MNTRIDYMYRDGSNYKQTSYVVFAGAITDEEKRQLFEHLDQGMWFIPEQVGLHNPRDDWGSHYDDDHVWNELDERDIELTDQAPINSGDEDIHAFVARFVATEWDVEAAVRLLEQFVAGTPQGK